MSGAGDINGDGYDDMLIGAPGHSNPENAGLERSGTVFIVHGSASASTSFDLKNANTTIGSSNLNDFAAGFSVSKAGDINGDGFDDVIIGQPYAGLASVTHRHTGQAFIMLDQAPVSQIPISIPMPT